MEETIMSAHTSESDSADDGDNLGDICFKIQTELDFTKHLGALDATVTNKPSPA
ncbi:MAG: hypothetical protein OER77_02590 [Myxococcales bacterium]|nr:hypothetical protein [Myxococcales bacterium]